MRLRTRLIMEDHNKMTSRWNSLPPIPIKDLDKIWHAKNLLMVILFLNVCCGDGNLHLEHKSSNSDFCIKETASAICDRTKIISIKLALFGRMKSESRCIASKTTRIGCSADATDRIDRWCSGRQNCSFAVADLIRLYETRCEDSANYLALEYTCIPALSPRNCKGNIELQEDEAYFSYPSAALPHLGRESCPLRLTAKPRQKLRIYFKSIFKMTSDVKSENIECQAGEHLMIQFKEKSAVKRENVCGYQRRDIIYTSDSQQVEISFPIAPKGIQSVVFYYRVIGCPQIVPPVGGWVDQKETVTKVQCNTTKEIWYLTCKGTSWNGLIGNCTPGDNNTGHRNKQISGPFSYSIIMAVFLGVLIGVIIGVLLLGIVYLWYRRRPRSPYQDPDSTNAGYYPGRDQKDMYTYNMTDTIQRPVIGMENHRDPRAVGTGYGGGGAPDYTAYHSSNCPTHSHSSLYGKYMGIMPPDESGNTLITHCPHSNEGLTKTGSAIEHTCNTGPGGTCYFDCGNRTEKP